MTLNEFIDNHFEGKKSAFARANDIPKQRVTDWINAGYIVNDGWLYSPRKRELRRG